MKACRVQQITVKSVIRRSSQADWFFCNRYSASPYRGCSHGCVYCDGRAEKYYVEGDFEQDLIVRSNFVDCLKAELPRIREKGIFEFGSGVSDVYQPLEEKYGLMKQAAELLLETTLPVMVLTKSALIQRDLELWKKKHIKDGFVLGMTLTTLDEDLASKSEPGASSVQERLDTLSLFKKEGIPAGVFAMPLLPGLNDSVSSFKALSQEVAERGLDFIIPSHLTLRPGRQKDFYMDFLKKHYPEKSERTLELYKEERPSGNTIKSYRDRFFPEIISILDRLKIPGLIPHNLYKPLVSRCDEISILLQHMAMLYTSVPRELPRLMEVIKRYRSWLLEQRKLYNRRRSLDRDYLDHLLVHSFRNGDFSEIIQNEKMVSFLSKIILDGKILDYANLKLI